MAIIGIDLDNTVICYEQIFDGYLQDLAITRLEGYSLKDSLKTALIAADKSEYRWQKIQGEVYGERMHSAVLFPGFMRFLLTAITRGDKLIFISHKTKFGHHDQKKINLREVANDWLEKNIFLELSDSSCFLNERVIYADTREEKIDAIKRMNCDIFIDDLPEVLFDKKFPVEVKKLLFSSNAVSNINQSIFSTWNEIRELLYSPLNDVDIKNILHYKFADLKIDKVEIVRVGVNSSIAKIQSSDACCYALKMYPDFHGDYRSMPRKLNIFCQMNLLSFYCFEFR